MITQLLISSSGKPIITASYVIVGGGNGASTSGSDGLGGDVLSGSTIFEPGSYSVLIGAGGGQNGAGSSSSIYGLSANGGVRTTTLTINGETFSGIDQGASPRTSQSPTIPASSIKGSGALFSGMYNTFTGCVGASSGSPSICARRGGTWVWGVNEGGTGNNGVVILTIATALISLISTSGASITTSGSNTIYRYNSSGSITIT